VWLVVSSAADLQATGREKDCIDTYKWLEDNHPIPKVKKQVRCHSRSQPQIDAVV
jgi:hypothetical protein